MPLPPEHREERDAGRLVRQWWREKDPDRLLEHLDRMSLADMMVDLGKLSALELAKQLADPKLDLEAKREIALTMAPKMVAETRGRPMKQPTPPGTPPTTPVDDSGEELLTAYRMRTG